ncbi:MULTISPECIES: dihydroorotase [Sphingobacterium]|jgi:dihydroorotase|uniref:Dihydroorotase n=1 Tax=Sphingobacterium multivorum TaxID=28454 RepID=A0A654DQ32_SPHMU|nr:MULTISPECIES: dihydroorotase [Sphingobacterium]HAE68462.1 dihydroorotase [Sphingobacterium sp.]QQT46545.1 dihydroorotase [Sphingobacterium multivorum]QQT60848.1 dihydroorotase [Sphingobacterium multivorum]SUJ89855.1 Dihydroorotase [Sphingobacterium multivorum]VXD08059.1 Dihydroorotase [Sphingobacterium multivorum]
MKSLLITSVKVILPGNEFHQQQVDVFIEKGKIAQIGKSVKVADKNIETLDGAGKVLAPGFFDLHANFGEPGLETKEDIVSGSAAAAAGGFTGIAVMPNTEPAIQSRSEVALIVNTAKGNIVDVHPIGAISKKREGKELAELFDMKQTGAVAFSDGNRSVQQAGLMSRALLYAKGFDGLIFSHAEDESMAGGNKMNEGEMSTYLGMKGIPNLAESLMVSRDLYLAEYTGAPIHFASISTPEAVDLIKKAKAKGLPVTCDVAAHQLVFTDDDIVGFDSNYKVSPPLRTKADLKVLLKGVKDGTIDAVVSQHTPHEIEFKNVEFHIAKNGIIGLQTVLPLLVRAGLNEEQIVNSLSVRPRQILGLEVPLIEEGAIANLVVFDPVKTWNFDETTNRSKSKNSPLFGQTLKGAVELIINNNQIIKND